jgi:hypothetical protein
MIIIIILKLNLEVNLKQDLDHGSGESSWIDLDQHKNKSDYYHNLKTRLGVDPEQRLGHESGVSTRVDQVNIRIKIVIIVVLKPDLRIDSGQILGHELEGSNNVDSCQCIDKSDCFHNFKTQSGS